MWCAAERARSGARPVHALIGGGDQLYNDNVWALPEAEAWLATPSHWTEPAPPALIASAEKFYLDSYLRCIHFHPAKELLANTPQARPLAWPEFVSSR